MKKKTWIVRAVSALLALLLLATLAMPLGGLAAYAEEETPAEKLERIQNEIDAIEAEISQLESDAADAEELAQYYTQKEAAVRAQIEALKEDIEQRREDLDAKQKQLAQQVLAVQEAQDLLGERLRAMYEMKRSNPLSILFGLDSVSAMLRFSENLRTITVSNDEVVNNLKAEKAQFEQEAAVIQSDLDALNAQEAQLEVSQQELAESIQKANNRISEIEAQQQAEEAALADKKEQYKAAQAEWVAWAASNTSDDYIADGNGQFVWPIPGYYGISSDYGVGRWVFGVYDVHRGMDIPAPAGKPIYAAAGGVVSTKAHWSYGTCVKISHSSSMVTIYGHMSARAEGIGEGTIVAQGQLIGYVGSTGNSTGNHLHFELDINGQPASARPYLDPNIVNALYWT